MTSTNVSVVIPVHGRPLELARVLDALASQTMASRSFEILVCDDGSNDVDRERLEQATRKATNARYLRQPKRGPAAARNLGIANARGGIIAFTDSDTIPAPGWLEALIAPFSDIDVIAVEGPVRPPAAPESPLDEAPRNEGSARLTANIAYRRSALLAVGGLDEAYPYPAFEDAELALAAERLGRFAWARDAVVTHPWRRTTLAVTCRRLRYFDWLLVTALRHGCLGWTDRPTRFPRLRVAIAAAVTLPAGRFRQGLVWLRRRPIDACARLGLSLVEAIGGALMAPRWLLWRAAPPRRPLRLLEAA